MYCTFLGCHCGDKNISVLLYISEHVEVSLKLMVFTKTMSGTE